MERFSMMGIEFLPTDNTGTTADKLLRLKQMVTREGWAPLAITCNEPQGQGMECSTPEWAKKVVNRIIVTCHPRASKVMLWALWNSEPWVLTAIMWRFNEYLNEYGKLTADMIERIVLDCVKAANYNIDGTLKRKL